MLATGMTCLYTTHAILNMDSYRRTSNHWFAWVQTVFQTGWVSVHNDACHLWCVLVNISEIQWFPLLRFNIWPFPREKRSGLSHSRIARSQTIARFNGRDLSSKTCGNNAGVDMFSNFSKLGHFYPLHTFFCKKNNRSVRVDWCIS